MSLWLALILALSSSIPSLLPTDESINQQVDAAPEIIERLATVLRNEPALRVLQGRSWQTSPNSSSSIDDIFPPVAQWLLAQSRRGRRPEEVVDQLEAFVVDNSVPMRAILALWGIEPRQPIEVCEGIKLVPFSSLPHSDVSEELTGANRFRQPIPESGILPRPLITAALVREFAHGPIITSGRLPTEAEQTAVRANDRTDLIREIARCLVAVYAVPVSPILFWYHTDETVPLFGGASGGGGWPIEHLHRFAPGAIAPVATWPPEEVTRSIVGDYFGLDGRTRDQLRVSLTRLNSAMQRFEVADTAIDLGIALEALLTRDREPYAPISYLVRLRGTVLLGGDAETRKDNYYRLRELYNLRSKAAHGESIEEIIRPSFGPGSASTETEAEFFLREGARMCSEMIKRVIQNGQIPDWEAMVVGW